MLLAILTPCMASALHYTIIHYARADAFIVYGLSPANIDENKKKKEINTIIHRRVVYDYARRVPMMNPSVLTRVIYFTKSKFNNLGRFAYCLYSEIAVSVPTQNNG